MTLFEKIKEVTELQSLPGFEGQVRNHIRQKNHATCGPH